MSRGQTHGTDRHNRGFDEPARYCRGERLPAVDVRLLADDRALRPAASTELDGGRAAAAQSMQDQADHLAKVVSVFKLDIAQAAGSTQTAVSPQARPAITAAAQNNAKLGHSPKPRHAAAAPAARGSAKPGNQAKDEWEEF